MAFDFSKASGMGTDTIDRGVLGPPFLSIIQKGSPEFDETHKRYQEKKIEGCRPGQVVFEPERVILPQPILVVPIAQTALYTEWKPNKGGFVGNRSLDITSHPEYKKGTPGSKDQYKEYLGQNELVYTITFLILFQYKGEWKQGMVAFTATQLKHARVWSKQLLGMKFPDSPNIQPPIFAAKWNLSTAAESNQAGGWFGWNITNAGFLSPEADQALLELAFSSSKEASLALPRPQAQAQLAPATVVTDDKEDGPY